MIKENGYKKLEGYGINGSSDFELHAKNLIEDSRKKNIAIEEDVKTLKNQIDMDIRDNIPTQIYSVVSGIIGLIKKLEEVDKDEGK